MQQLSPYLPPRLKRITWADLQFQMGGWMDEGRKTRKKRKWEIGSSRLRGSRRSHLLTFLISCHIKAAVFPHRPSSLPHPRARAILVLLSEQYYNSAMRWQINRCVRRVLSSTPCPCSLNEQCASVCAVST